MRARVACLILFLVALLGTDVCGAATIDRASWILRFVDSQETVGENGAAINAFDGNTSTIWHTAWFNVSQPPPHEIQIDLGAVYDIDGFRYLSRQDGGVNGNVGQYEFYVSSDGASWGTAVASGVFAGNAQEKQVTFAVKRGRYVRFRALSEVNGNPWTSMSELNVLGTLVSGNLPPDGRIDNPAADITINAGDVVQFAGSASEPGGSLQFTYLWHFGNGSGIPDSTLEDPGFVQFTSPGTYLVTLVVTDSQGNADPAPATRIVTVRSNSPVIAKSGWKFGYVDSQELAGEDGAATNAFDGNPSTFWHTAWVGSSPSTPHEIQIDLGDSFDIDGFRYLPRQDGSQNGNIGQYEFYVSGDMATWGTPVSTGIFAGSSTPKDAYFTPKNGRYVRLRALSEVNGNPWTTVAELDVTGTTGSGNQLPNGVIDLPAGTVTLRTGERVRFSASGSDPDNNFPLTFRWNFGAGSGVPDYIGADPGEVQFDNAGTYQVTLSVTDALGGSDPTPASRIVSVFSNSFELSPNWASVSTPPFELLESDGVTNPVITAASVTDVPASFVADPYLFQDNGTWYLFFEVLNKNTDQGDISVASSTDGRHWRYERIVLNETFHLSNPYVFKVNGVYYMIPETYQRNEVRIYTATNFPFEWRYHATLVNGRPFVDAAVFWHNNVWWMFVSDTGNANCYLYYSDNLASGWVAHPASPVVRNDQSKARPAGRSFVFDGNRVIRTTQKADVTYGEQVRAFQVDVLTKTDYSEHEITESPLFRNSGAGWNATGMHHFDPWWTGSRWLVATDGRNGEIWSIGVYESPDPSVPNGVIDTPGADVTIAAGEKVQFTSTGSDLDGNLPLGFRWHFGDGSGVADSSAEDPGLVQFNIPGSYVVSLNVTDASGNADPSPATRRITVQSNLPAIQKSQWKLKFVDSQELVGENGAATNAFDGNPATIWHTRWYEANPPPPHEIQIDLGATYDVGGFRYLPRQDGFENGTVSNYEFYVSSDGANWGSAVAAGAFPASAGEKEVLSAAKRGRYIRLRALSEVNSNPWTSMAEMEVLGQP